MDIIRAIKDGNLSRVIELLESGINLNFTHGLYNYSLLYTSLLYSQFNIFYELIDRGADINQPNDLGQTPVSSCVSRGYIKPLNKLLELNANIYGVLYDSTTCIFTAKQLKFLNLDREKIYYSIMFTDRAIHGELNFIKSEILMKNYVPIKTWIQHLSKNSCLELYNWIKPVIKVSSLLGKDYEQNIIKQNVREQVCNEGLAAQLIMSYLETSYISELRRVLSIKLSL
jgi:ankyrin repeat protein